MTCLCEKNIPDGTVVSAKCIKDVWPYSEFESEDLTILSSIGIRKEYCRGDAVFHQGDPANSMFFIKSGLIKLSKIFADGREGTLDYRKAGDTLGENMFGGSNYYPVSAWCLEDTYTCGFKKPDFEHLILEHPIIGLRVIRKQSELIESLSTRLGDMVIPSLEERLYKLLVNVARNHGVSVDGGIRIRFPLTHEDLSFLTGSHRVTITKAIKKLRKAGKIYKEGRSYLLPTAAGSGIKTTDLKK